MAKKEEAVNPVSGCMMKSPCEGERKCAVCGFYEPEYQRRKQIPLTVDPETGLKRKYVGKEKSEYAETEKDGG